jgi:chromosome segregation ATPase
LARGPAAREGLFAPRQIYIRGDQGSHYVTLTKGLQIGVACAALLVLLGLVGIGTGFALKYVEAAGQRTVLNELAAANAELMANREEPSQIEELTRALAVAEATANSASEGGARIEALQGELDLARQEIETLRGELSTARAEETALNARLETQEAALREQATSEAVGTEASQLHAQLEVAYEEVDELKAANAALDRTLAEQNSASQTWEAKSSAAETEIERLNQTLQETRENLEDSRAEADIEILSLQADVAELTTARDHLRVQRDYLAGQLDRTEARVATLQADAAAASADHEAAAIATDLEQAALLSRIETLGEELEAAEAQAEALVEAEAAASSAGQDVGDLRLQLETARGEIDRLKDEITSQAEAAPSPVAAADAAQIASAAGAGDVETLRTELANAQAEIIKLNANWRAARQRLADNHDTSQPATGAASDARLKQQLTDARQRLRQLDSALAEAKLREVAIELALVSVVPPPSPPAPR